jgi:Ca2+-binding RTX toxin-like protein
VATLACDTPFVTGQQNADVLDAGNGNDLLIGESGPDQLLSGAHTDTVSYADRRATEGGVTATIADDCSGTPCARANDGRTDIFSGTPGNQTEGDSISLGTENVVGTLSDDSLAGNGGPNALTGGGGTDTLDGRLGADLLDPGTGAGNVVIGGGGFDTVTYRAITGFDGVDVTLDDVADDGPEFSGTDNVRSDVEGVIGSVGQDVIVAQLGAVANVLYGGLGNDVLEGSAGDDRLVGDGGADTLEGGAGDDVLQSVDGAVDTEVDCGDGAADTALHDASETPVRCETLEPFAASGLASW